MGKKAKGKDDKPPPDDVVICVFIFLLCTECDYNVYTVCPN